jgi:hypothetical protein
MGFIFLVNGLNWWWKILPYPSLHDPALAKTPPFIQAMIDTGFMFDVVRVLEVAVGIALLADAWTVLALLVAFPISAAIWTVDLFLISGNLRAQVMGWAALLLNLFLMFANWNIYSPLLVFRSPGKSSFWSKGAGKS